MPHGSGDTDPGEVSQGMVLKIALDVTDPIKAEASVAQTVEEFGDVELVAAAATGRA